MKRKLKIYFTSDVHGYLYPTTYGDRVEKDMGLFQCAEEFVKDEDTLVIDGGDMLQGSAMDWYCRQELQSPEKLVEAMNDCGYDYYTLGNHDFNYGPEYQREYREANRARCVCQNVTDRNGAVLFPYDIRQMSDGLRVGIVGIVTDFINVWEKEENLKGVCITDPFEAARQALEELRGKTDLNICIYHGGFECDLNTGRILSDSGENVGFRICRELDFDVLLTGHQHMSIPGRNLYGTWIVQPMDQAREYHYLELTEEAGKIQITSELRKPDGKKGKVLRTKYQELEAAVQTWLDRPAGHLSRALLPEEKVKMAFYGTPIADFLNRVQLHFSGAEISAVGLANEVAGFREAVSTRDILATYPYPNTLIVCEITGRQLKAAMERSAEYFACREDGTVEVAESFLYPKIEHYNYDYYMGVEYEIHPECPPGNRIQKLTREGCPVQEEDVFTLCLNNYRYSGAGGYPMYPECRLIREINLEMVELIMEYFRQYPFVTV